LLLVAFLLVNAPNCHLSLVLASVVQGDAVNCNNSHHGTVGHQATYILNAAINLGKECAMFYNDALLQQLCTYSEQAMGLQIFQQIVNHSLSPD